MSDQWIRLRNVLEAAGLHTPEQLEEALKRCEGMVVQAHRGKVTLVRVGEKPDGSGIWQFQAVEH